MVLTPNGAGKGAAICRKLTMGLLRALLLLFFFTCAWPAISQVQQQGDSRHPGNKAGPYPGGTSAEEGATAGSGLPLPLAVGFVDGAKLIKRLANSNQDFQALNRQLKPLVEAAKPMLVLQDVVWVSSRVDVTERIARLAGEEGEAAVLEIPRVSQGQRFVTLAVIDPKWLDDGSAAGQEPAAKQRQRELAANVGAYARKKAIDIVLSDHSFASSDLNITGAVMAFDKNGPAIGKRGAMTYLKVGWISVPRIFRESPMALRASREIESDFQARDRELRDLAERSATDPEARSQFGPKKASFDRDLKRRMDEENNKVIAKANRLIRALAEAEGYDLILQDVVWGAPEVDVTPAIIAGLGE